MPKVLVDQDQITQLGLTLDDQKKKTDTVFGLLQDLKQEISDINANTPDDVDLSPLLDKANALDDELGSMTPPVVPPTEPAPADGTAPAAPATVPDEQPADNGAPTLAHADANPNAQTQDNPNPQPDQSAVLAPDPVLALQAAAGVEGTAGKSAPQVSQDGRAQADQAADMPGIDQAGNGAD